MPLLDVEGQLFVCKPSETTVQICVKNAGTEDLRLWNVYPIGDSRDHIQVDFGTESIPPNGSIDITVTINDYWTPAKIKFNTNCPQAGKVVYVLRPKRRKGPNLWLFPDERYNEDLIFFPEPKPSLRLPVIVQSTQDSTSEFDLCNIKLSSEDSWEETCDPNEIEVYCEKTKRKTSRSGDKRCYKILNSLGTYQIHFICIDFPQGVIRDRTVAQVIQLTICTNSKLQELGKQEVSIQLAGFEVTPVKKISFCSTWRKNKHVEFKIKNSGTHPLRIFKFPTDLTKVKVEYRETDGERAKFEYPIVIKTGESEKFGVRIISSLRECLWSGIGLEKISVPIYANAGPDPKKSYVFADRSKIGRGLIWRVGLFLLIVSVLPVYKYWCCYRQPEQEVEVIVSSYPLGKIIRVDGKEEGITPIRLQVKEKADIQIWHSNRQQVKDVIEAGTIFFPNSKWKVNKKESK